jgi:hypothetical protein
MPTSTPYPRLKLATGYEFLLSEEQGAWERLPDPEPDWQSGDVVRDADGDVLVRRADGRWTFGYDTFEDKTAVRPLVRLVPEVKA